MTGTYAYDAAFLNKFVKTLELTSPDGHSRVLLCPGYQGRVMTSTSDGDKGNSYGWINYDLISSGELRKQFNPVGGEERFWLGPEGGQYSLYFAPGDSFNIGKWQVPKAIDTVGYELVASTKASATFKRAARLKNYSNTDFEIVIQRTIDLIGKAGLEEALGQPLPDVKFVAYRTTNSVSNAGSSAWKKDSGLLSIWLLGMFTPSDNTTVIIPFHPSAEARSLINTNYFGDIPPDRLTISDSVLFFKCDGKLRSKIGLPPSIAKPITGSYDPVRNVLTVIAFELDKNGDYVNSKWEMQQEPYRGDAVNSYNDGPLPDGGQLGPFYELESSSAARELKPGDQMIYRQVTCHFEGDETAIRDLAIRLLGAAPPSN